MNQRRERIPAKDVKESKNWSLPYWTESGDVVQQEAQNHDNDPDVWVEDEEEMEVEPLTAEALEKIRQEAYNDGLEQGLIEGRQKGEKQGFDDGYQDGHRKGLEEGKSQGYKDGLNKGNKEAEQTLDKQKKAFKQASQHVFNNLDQAFQSFKKEIEDTLPDLVEMLATGVIGGELEQGSEHIMHLVRDALDAIPVDKKQVTILVNEADLPFLEAGLDDDYQIVSDDRIEPGGCKLQSKNSSADFSFSTRVQQILSDYRKQLQLGSQSVEEAQTDSIMENVDLEREYEEDAQVNSNDSEKSSTDTKDMVSDNEAHDDSATDNIENKDIESDNEKSEAETHHADGSHEQQLQEQDLEKQDPEKQAPQANSQASSEPSLDDSHNSSEDQDTDGSQNE